MQRCLLLFFLLASSLGQAQDFKQYLFKDKKVCSFSESKDSIFLFQDFNVLKIFSFEKITSVEVTEACERNFFSPRLYHAVLQFEYSENYALQVFDTLVVEGKKSARTILIDIHKPGRIYGLSKTKKSLTLITLNSCANYPDFKKIVKSILDQKYFDRILVIPCGAQAESVKVYW